MPAGNLRDIVRDRLIAVMKEVYFSDVVPCTYLIFFGALILRFDCIVFIRLMLKTTNKVLMNLLRL